MAASLIPGEHVAAGVLKAAEKALANGDVAEASKLINNHIGSNSDKDIAGKFAGQGVGGGSSRGDIFFRIKGNDVVVTKPDGGFVTALKGGINNNSVKNALKGEPQ